MTSFNLEQSARELTEAIAKGPPLSGVPLAEARKAVEAAQSAPISMPDVDESWVAVSSAFGDFEVRIVRPHGSTGPLPVILYMHGGGWILGSWITHDLLTRRLAVGANAAVAFVEYSRAPEAKYPAQIERATPQLNGSPNKGQVADSTSPGSLLPATLPAGTCRRCSPSWRSSVGVFSSSISPCTTR
jgi:acetyl esterase/lipase